MESKQNEDLYDPIPLSKIAIEEELPVSIYLKINNKFIKYKKAKDTIDTEKYNTFISMNLEFCYVLNKDFEKIMNWIVEVKRKKVKKLNNSIQSEVEGDFTNYIEDVEEIKEKVYTTFADEQLDSEKVEILQDQVSEFISEVSKSPMALSALSKFPDYGQSIVEHSINVANLAVFIALALGHGHPYVLENVYMGALFHDYGMSKIPENVLLNPHSNLYAHHMEAHPKQGAFLVKKMQSIPAPVMTIILEHHERHDGQGFPLKKQGDDIYELSQIVSLANFIDNHITENNKRNPQKFKTALKAVKLNSGRHFNPEMAERAIEAIEIGLFKTSQKAS